MTGMSVRLVLALLVIALSSGAAHADHYKSARALYRDCAAALATDSSEALLKSKRCAEYLDRVFDGWLLSQRSGVCSRLRRSDLAKGYVDYWNEKGLGVIRRFRSPAASVREFLDAHSERCSTPDGLERRVE
jgi:hypothetical protein